MAGYPASRLRRALTFAAATGVLAGCGKAGAPQFRAIDITGADYARELELPDVEGRLRRVSEFHGKVTVVFFGFTHCPEVCPTTLYDLTQDLEALGKDADRLRVAFITVDPAQDTPELMKTYLGSFDPRIVGLTGTEEEIAAVAKAYKVYYRKVPTESGYTMDHTAGSYIFDKQGRIRLFTRHGGGAEALQHDVKLLLADA